MSRHVVAAVSSIPPGTRQIVTISGRSIGIFNVDGKFFALRNQCPHQGGPLCAGTVMGRLEATLPGQYEYQYDHKRLKCPWHGWEFDMDTGQSWFDPRNQRVRSYPVTIEAGEKLVGATVRTEALPGPYVAETVPVVVEGNYVVLELPT